VIQFELECHCSREEIDHYRCSKNTPNPNAEYPHESLLIAIMLDNFESGLTSLK